MTKKEIIAKLKENGIKEGTGNHYSYELAKEIICYCESMTSDEYVRRISIITEYLKI